MKTLIAALVLSLALPVAAIAQSDGANQLREELMTSLPKILGKPVDADMLKMLSDEQITKVAAILGGNENDQMKRRQIEAAMGN